MLDDDAIARYARQIVVPGIGAAGQEKLLNSTVLVVGHPRGCATAKLYLEAAGVTVATTLSRSADVVVACSPASLDEETRDAIRRLSLPICWYELTSGGIDFGVCPDSQLLPISSSSNGSESAHDGASCAAASSACAIIIGLRVPSDRFHLEY